MTETSVRYGIPSKISAVKIGADGVWLREENAGRDAIRVVDTPAVGADGSMGWARGGNRGRLVVKSSLDGTKAKYQTRTKSIRCSWA